MRNKRWDGTRIRELDGYHAILPYVMPKRADAEVSVERVFDITELNKFMAEYNAEHGTNLKLFHAICTAVARTIYHRPKMNIFISGRTFYQQNDITLSFVVKRTFEDASEESLMTMVAKPEMNLEGVSRMIIGDVKKVRKEESNDLDQIMNFVGKLPRWFLEIFFFTMRRMEYHGIYPKSLAIGDPNYSTVLLSNLGSIGADSCYHHLSDYGTCSIMITLGKAHKELRADANGEIVERDVVDCTFTLDERIADGFYFAKSLRIMDYLIANPEALMEEIQQEMPVEM